MLKPYESVDTNKYSNDRMSKLLKPGCNMRMYSPTLKCPTVFRPQPLLLTADDGTITEVPWRNNEGNFGMSWFVQDYVVSYWGIESKFIAFCDCIDQDTNWPMGSPFAMFYRDVSSVDDFKWMLNGLSTSATSPTKDRAVSRIQACGFLKGLLFEHSSFKTNNHRRYSDPLWGVILQLSRTAKEAFEKLINQPAEGVVRPTVTDEDPFGWDSQYACGSPIALKTGKIFEFLSKGMASGAGEDEEVTVSADRAAEQARGGGGDERELSPFELNSYTCRVWERKSTLELPANAVLTYNEPFENMFHYMTGEEQVMLLMQSFGVSARDALVYTFGDTGILPMSFVKGRTSVDLGASKAPSADAHKAIREKVSAEPSVSVSVEDDDVSVGVGIPDDSAEESETSSEPLAWEDQGGGEPVEAPQQQQSSSAIAEGIRARLSSIKNK